MRRGWPTVYVQGQRSRSQEINNQIPCVQDTEKMVWHRIMTHCVIVTNLKHITGSTPALNILLFNILPAGDTSVPRTLLLYMLPNTSNIFLDPRSTIKALVYQYCLKAPLAHCTWICLIVEYSCLIYHAASCLLFHYRNPSMMIQIKIMDLMIECGKHTPIMREIRETM